MKTKKTAMIPSIPRTIRIISSRSKPDIWPSVSNEPEKQTMVIRIRQPEKARKEGLRDHGEESLWSLLGATLYGVIGHYQ